MSLGEYLPWNLLPRSPRIQNTATSTISSAETPRRVLSRQWLFVLQAHALSEPLRALPSHPWLMFAQTLAREGWLLIVSENATLTGEAGNVKRRLYELLKLDSFCWGVEETIEKYLTHCDKVLIVFLKGKKRIWPDNRVDFIPISDFYMELRGKKEEDIITDLENLRKGILRPELQARLDRYQRKTSQASRMIPSEQSMERAVLL